jgi:hypothetical protein
MIQFLVSFCNNDAKLRFFLDKCTIVAKKKSTSEIIGSGFSKRVAYY